MRAQLNDLPALVFDLAAPGLRILHPPRADYAAVAQRLGAALQGAAVMEETVAGAREVTGVAPVIVLGNVMESAVGRRLYFEAYDFTDYAFPGPGGWVLRTIRDPLGTGAPVLLVGGSDVAGVAAAAQRLMERVRRDGPVSGYFNEVQLGAWTTAAQLDTVRYLADDDAVWERVGQSGSWDYMDNIAKCGTGYLRTGDERYLARFQRELQRFIATDVFNPNQEAPVMLHGRMYMLLTVWDLVRDHPLFPAEVWREVEEMFLHVARSGEGTAQIAEVSRTRAVRYNHHTRSGLDAFFLGRYFARRHALPEAQDWLATAERFFAPQLESAKPACDSWGHQWAASLFNTLVYALATGRQEFATSPVGRAAADRALIAYGRAAPRHYLAACALASGDSGYLGLERGLEEMARDAAELRLVPASKKELVTFTDELLRTFTGNAPIVRREDLLGQAAAPLDALWYETIETPVYNPDKIFAVTVPRAEGFDKIALRDGWAEEDFYLLLDGISGGHHAYQDANCLVWLREGGVDWFLPQKGYMHALGSRGQNGVNVALDGRGPGRMHRYARLRYRGTQGDFSAVGTSLDGLGETSWERHILRKRGAWTLVLDRVTAQAAGELLAERFWFPQGECTRRTDGFVSRQRRGNAHAVTLNFVSATEERARAAVPAGGSVVLVGLLWTNTDADTRAWNLTATEKGWRIGGGAGEAIDVELGASGIAASCGGERLEFGDTTVARASFRTDHAALRTLPLVCTAEMNSPLEELRFTGKTISAVVARESAYVVGASDGTVISLDAAGHERWRAQLPGAILSLEITGDAVVVGEERGALSWFDGGGRKLWTVEIPWVTLPWAYWSEERSRIREIAAADINGDGVEEILVSNADRRVYAFDRAGRELWKRPIEWGVFTAMWPGMHEGEFALFGGTSRPSIHGYAILLRGDGAVRGHFKRADLTCWSMPSALRDVLAADIDGDGAIELVTAVDTNCRQLVAYTADGAVKWELDVAGSAGALAFDVTARRVFCASDAGYVVAVDGTTGRREWCAWLGEAAQLLWLLEDGRLLAIAERGAGWILATQGETAGEVIGKFELGVALTGLPRPGDHRGGRDRKLILGTADGRVLVN